jgi:hypothetical protein
MRRVIYLERQGTNDLWCKAVPCQINPNLRSSLVGQWQLVFTLKLCPYLVPNFSPKLYYGCVQIPQKG